MGVYPASSARVMTLGLSAIKIPLSGSCRFSSCLSVSLAYTSSSRAEKSVISMIFGIPVLPVLFSAIILQLEKMRQDLLFPIKEAGPGYPYRNIPDLLFLPRHSRKIHPAAAKHAIHPLTPERSPVSAPPPSSTEGSSNVMAIFLFSLIFLSTHR